MERYQKQIILKDLHKKLVFLTGPRQVGKTWLAQDIAASFPNSVYLNYDHFNIPRRNSPSIAAGLVGDG